MVVSRSARRFVAGRLRISRSLRRTLARNSFEVTADQAFDAVIDACAEPRRYTDSTWITADMAAAYKRLHALGWAHSFEAWQDGRLAGGLYGISIGRMFFGESMFSRAADASKVAFVGAVRYLKARGVALIDCQIQSGHLTRLGAVNMPRAEFLEHLKRYGEPARTPDRGDRPSPHSSLPRAAPDRAIAGPVGLCNNAAPF